MDTKSKAIEQKKTPAIAVSEFLNTRSDKLAKWCVEGSGLTAIDLVRVGTMVVAREPKFHDPRVWPSLYLALITAAQLGLEPSGPMAEAYILPYWDKKMGINLAQLQPGYRGLIKLMTQGGDIKSVRSYVVHGNDHFKISLGSNRQVIHEPCWKGEPGPAVAVYSIATYHDGDEDYEIAPWSDVIKAKDSSKGKSPAWDKWPEQMARKFIIKRHSNQLPLSPVARKAIEVDNIDSDQVAIETQNVIEADVIEEPKQLEKKKSKLASKLKERKDDRQKKETPPPKDEEKPSEGVMCNFCGTNVTEDPNAPCAQCQTEIAESEEAEAKAEN